MPEELEMAAGEGWTYDQILLQGKPGALLLDVVLKRPLTDPDTGEDTGEVQSLPLKLGFADVREHFPVEIPDDAADFLGNLIEAINSFATEKVAERLSPPPDS